MAKQQRELLLFLRRFSDLEIGTDGGGRTHTTLRSPDFESSASANSATSALESADGVNNKGVQSLQAVLNV